MSPVWHLGNRDGGMSVSYGSETWTYIGIIDQVPPPNCQEGFIYYSHAMLSHPISDGSFLLENKTDKTGAVTHKGGGGHARQGKEN